MDGTKVAKIFGCKAGVSGMMTLYVPLRLGACTRDKCSAIEIAKLENICYLGKLNVGWIKFCDTLFENIYACIPCWYIEMAIHSFLVINWIEISDAVVNVNLSSLLIL